MDFELNDEQRLWRQSVHEFCANEIRPRAAELDAAAEFPADLFRRMAPLGLLGMAVPEDYGGSGVDAIGAAIATEELGWACGGTALSVTAHNGLGCAPFVLFGSEEQKRRWLPGLATGRPGLGALALTESGAGSDLASVRTHARLEGDEWVIQGSKAWITNASVASVIITYLRLDEPGDRARYGLIVVPRDTPGLHVHPAEKKMGVRASPTHALTYENVRVPRSYLLGEPGAGLRQTLQILDGGRIGIGALSIGLAQAALEEAIRYAKQRTAFGRTLSEFQAIQWMIADATVQIEAARLLIYRAAWLKQQGAFFNKEAAVAKLFATEMAEKVCRDSIQILGSYGYSSEYPVERMYRDARLMTIGEGTSEVQRMVIARRALGNE